MIALGSKTVKARFSRAGQYGARETRPELTRGPIDDGPGMRPRLEPGDWNGNADGRGEEIDLPSDRRGHPDRARMLD